MIPMNNIGQYQVYNPDTTDQEDDGQSATDLISPQMKARMSFEAVEEPIKYMIKSNGFGLMNFNSTILPTVNGIGSMETDIFQNAFNTAKSKMSTIAQMDGRGAADFVVKKSAGVWAKALEVAARVGR